MGQAQGRWRILLIRGPRGGPRPATRRPPRAAELVEALTARGVTPKIAAELVEAHPPGRIQTKLEVFDWLLKNEDKRIGKNPAGYLVASIRADYQAPGDFPADDDAPAPAAAADRPPAAERRADAPHRAAPRPRPPGPARPTSAPLGGPPRGPSARRSSPRSRPRTPA